MSILSSAARRVSDDGLAIAWRIRQFRYKRGFSQTEIADALGISFQQFQKPQLNFCGAVGGNRAHFRRDAA